MTQCSQHATFRDLLLPIFTYPDATPSTAFDNAAHLASRIGGAVTVLSVAVDLPQFKNVLANALVGLDEMARKEEAQSALLARRNAKAFLAAAGRLAVPAAAIVEQAAVYTDPDHVCARARTHDLTLIGIGPAVAEDLAVAEAVLFGSGRPILLFPEAEPLGGSASFERALIAWDGSRAAARAVADALPLLAGAGEVRILTGVGEKPTVTSGAGRDMVRHLKTHDIDAKAEEVPTGHEPFERVLRPYLARHAVDLLVMGGFGHSRTAEYLLGGATCSIMRDPPCAVLMSH